MTQAVQHDGTNEEIQELTAALSDLIQDGYGMGVAAKLIRAGHGLLRLNVTEKDLMDSLEVIQALHQEGFPFSHVKELLKVYLGFAEEGMAHLELDDARQLLAAKQLFVNQYGRPKAFVMGSARTKDDHLEFRNAQLLGGYLRAAGIVAVTGGGPGIMEAVGRGSGDDNTINIAVELPFEDSVPAENRAYFTRIFLRQVLMIRESQIYMTLLGGVGSDSELKEAFTSMQTGKATPKPLIVLPPEDDPEYYRDVLGQQFVAWRRHETISIQDESIVQKADTPAEAMDMATRFFHNYDSVTHLSGSAWERVQANERAINGRELSGNKGFRIRLRHPLTPEELAEFQDKHADVLANSRQRDLGDTWSYSNAPRFALEGQWTDPKPYRLFHLIYDLNDPEMVSALSPDGPGFTRDNPLVLLTDRERSRIKEIAARGDALPVRSGVRTGLRNEINYIGATGQAIERTL